MVFDSLSAAWEMGGHGAFVWSAYGATLVVLCYLIVAPIRRHERHVRQIQGDIRRASRPSDNEATNTKPGAVSASRSTGEPDPDRVVREGRSHAS